MKLSDSCNKPNDVFLKAELFGKVLSKINEKKALKNISKNKIIINDRLSKKVSADKIITKRQFKKYYNTTNIVLNYLAQKFTMIFNFLGNLFQSFDILYYTYGIHTFRNNLIVLNMSIPSLLALVIILLFVICANISRKNQKYFKKFAFFDGFSVLFILTSFYFYKTILYAQIAKFLAALIQRKFLKIIVLSYLALITSCFLIFIDKRIFKYVWLAVFSVVLISISFLSIRLVPGYATLPFLSIFFVFSVFRVFWLKKKSNKIDWKSIAIRNTISLFFMSACLFYCMYSVYVTTGFLNI